MSYTKHTWQSEEIITADKLNNLEEGVSSIIPTVTGYLQDGDIFTVQTSSGTSKKMVWREITVPLTYVEKRPEGEEDWPDIDPSVDTENLFNILNSHTKSEALLVWDTPMFSGNVFLWINMGISHTILPAQKAFSLYCNTNGIAFNVDIIDDINKQCLFIEGDIGSSTIGYSLLVRGFLPVEE